MLDALAASPDASPQTLAASLYKPPGTLERKVKALGEKLRPGSKGDADGALTTADLDSAAQCGHWGTAGRPSDLFLQLFHDAVLSLAHDPFEGMVSPPLLGSNGVAPLSVISVIPECACSLRD